MDKRGASDLYDVIIIGGGPAGLTAGIYLARSRMKTLLIEKLSCGGQVLTADLIENYPGFPDGIRGAELTGKIAKQAKGFGLETEIAEVKETILKKGNSESFELKAIDGKEFQALSTIIATGAHWNKLGVPGEKELTGRGVSYCATCDGPLFKGKDVVVVGGGDTALEDALFLARFVNKLTIVHRRDKLRATKILQERAFANKRIEFCLSSVVNRILGKDRVEGMVVKDVVTDQEKEIRTDGVFIFIGVRPNSEFLKGILDMDEAGYIVTDNDMRTSRDGIFACGDVRKKNLRQVVTAVGEGAQAAFSARHHVEHLKGIEYR